MDIHMRARTVSKQQQQHTHPLERCRLPVSLVKENLAVVVRDECFIAPGSGAAERQWGASLVFFCLHRERERKSQ